MSRPMPITATILFQSDNARHGIVQMRLLPIGWIASAHEKALSFNLRVAGQATGTAKAGRRGSNRLQNYDTAAACDCE